MPNIIAYTWQADSHSVDATRTAYETGVLRVNNQHPYALDVRVFDEAGLPFNLEDSDGNLIHPVFDTDEVAESVRPHSDRKAVANDRKALELQVAQQSRDAWGAGLWPV
jgi:hypothetical protein